MIKRWLSLSRYPALLVFVLAGVLAVVFAFVTYNLFHLAMANLAFLRKFGLLAVMEGGLIQTLQIGGIGAVSLVCYLGFKACEVELMARYRRWQDD